MKKLKGNEGKEENLWTVYKNKYENDLMGVSESAGWYLESRHCSWRLFSLKQVEDRVAISSGVPFRA